MSEAGRKALEAIEEAISKGLIPQFELGQIYQMAMEHMEGSVCQQ